jgi:hypothetical protein
MTTAFASPSESGLAYLREVADATESLLYNLDAGKLLDGGSDAGERPAGSQLTVQEHRTQVGIRLRHLLDLLNPERRPISDVWPVTMRDGRWPFLSLRTLGNAARDLLAHWGIGEVATLQSWTPVLSEEHLRPLAGSGVRVADLRRITPIPSATAEDLDRSLSQLRYFIAEAPSRAPATTTQTNREGATAVDDAPWPEYMSAQDLAHRLNLPREATRKKLKRLANKYDCSIPVESPRRGESRTLYHVKTVLPELRK